VERPSIEVEIIEPDDGVVRQSVDVEFVVSTGTDVQTVYLTVNLSRFGVETPAAITMLPETGTDTGAGRLWLGIGMLLVGFGLLAGRVRSLFRRAA
jgi:LPXTG-motif cell wall-anchored protein